MLFNEACGSRVIDVKFWRHREFCQRGPSRGRPVQREDDRVQFLQDSIGKMVSQRLEHHSACHRHEPLSCLKATTQGDGLKVFRLA